MSDKWMDMQTSREINHSRLIHSALGQTETTALVFFCDVTNVLLHAQEMLLSLGKLVLFPSWNTLWTTGEEKHQKPPTVKADKNNFLGEENVQRSAF